MILNWTYENTETAAKAQLRVDDLTQIAAAYDITGFKVYRVAIPRKGNNVNITVDDERFSTYDDASSFLRTCCIALRKKRREEKAEELKKLNKLLKVPAFDSEQEERSFWETHDSTKYVDFSAAKLASFPNLNSSSHK